MDKYCNIRLKIPREIFNQVQEISVILKKRGWRQKDCLNIQDLLFLSLLKDFNTQFKNKFIEEHTPVDFLVSEALKEPSMRIKINRFLKANQKQKTEKGNKQKKTKSHLEEMKHK